MRGLRQLRVAPSRRPSSSSGTTTPRSRFSARCWVTRTAPGVEPTAAAVSSALSPTATRRISTSRWRGVSWCSRPPRRWASSPARACCSGSSCGAGRVGQLGHRLGAVAADGPEGVGHLVRGDPVDERPEGQPLDRVAAQRVDHGQADLLGHVVGGADHRLLAAEPAAAVAQHQRVDLREQLLAGPPVAGHGRGDQTLQRRTADPAGDAAAPGEAVAARPQAGRPAAGCIDRRLRSTADRASSCGGHGQRRHGAGRRAPNLTGVPSPKHIPGTGGLLPTGPVPGVAVRCPDGSHPPNGGALSGAPSCGLLSSCPTTDWLRALGSLGDIQVGVKEKLAADDYSSNSVVPRHPLDRMTPDPAAARTQRNRTQPAPPQAAEASSSARSGSADARMEDIAARRGREPGHRVQPLPHQAVRSWPRVSLRWPPAAGSPAQHDVAGRDRSVAEH